MRVFNVFYKRIFRYDPPVENRDNKPMYVLADGDHIYTLSHDIKRLAQNQEEEDDSEYALRASPDYNISEDRDFVSHKMIEHIDDIIKILRAVPTATMDENIEAHTDAQAAKVQHITYLVQKENDMAILWQLYAAKFMPQISYQAGRIAWMCIEVNEHKFIIKNQHFTHDSIDGIIEVNDEETYNKMNDLMFHFQTSIFKNDHKSHYSKQDVDILGEFRTVANVGAMHPVKEKNDLIELDISKAYTAAFAKIKDVPVFNEFDLFKPYKGEELKDHCLYSQGDRA